MIKCKGSIPVRSVHKNESGPHSDIALWQEPAQVLEASLSVVRKLLRSQERALPERRCADQAMSASLTHMFEWDQATATWLRIICSSKSMGQKVATVGRG